MVLEQSKACDMFDGCKKIYSMNNKIVVNHHGLFMYLDMLSYILPWHHNIPNILTYTNPNNSFCVRDNEIFEYLLGDQGCMSEEMYIILGKIMGNWKSIFRVQIKCIFQ
jgi:hypothetical protein